MTCTFSDWSDEGQILVIEISCIQFCVRRSSTVSMDDEDFKVYWTLVTKSIQDDSDPCQKSNVEDGISWSIIIISPGKQNRKSRISLQEEKKETDDVLYFSSSFRYVRPLSSHTGKIGQLLLISLDPLTLKICFPSSQDLEKEISDRKKDLDVHPTGLQSAFIFVAHKYSTSAFLSIPRFHDRVDLCSHFIEHDQEDKSKTPVIWIATLDSSSSSLNHDRNRPDHHWRRLPGLVLWSRDGNTLNAENFSRIPWVEQSDSFCQHKKKVRVNDNTVTVETGVTATVFKIITESTPRKKLCLEDLCERFFFIFVTSWEHSHCSITFNRYR